MDAFKHMRSHAWAVVVISAFVLLGSPATAQFSLYRVDNSFSTEWEATAFNNGRRVARDSDGFLHVVWHSRPTTGTAPLGTGCSIFYAYSTVPCNGNLAPTQNDWVIQEIVPVVGNPFDNRYPALVIEHGTPGDPTGNDVLHLVWQRDQVDPSVSGGVGFGDYEIWYMNTVGQDINIPGGFPAVWNPGVQLWNTPGHHDLVPSIACNYGNHLHVAFQGEGWDPDSEILYARSVDHGATWTDDVGAPLATFGGAAPPFNLSNNPCSSQCPSIACIVDAPTNPAISPWQPVFQPFSVDPYTYTTDTVHIAWHDKTDGNTGSCTAGVGDYRVWYRFSPDDGATWPVKEDVSLLSLGDRDTYVSLTVDYYDQPHVAFMHNMDNEHDPDIPNPANYLAGIAPLAPVAYPGPDPRMYGNLNQIITYTYRMMLPPQPGGVWQARQFITAGTTDDEFPSIAMDEQMGVHLAWQSWGSITSEYVIMVNFNGFNWAAPNPTAWTGWGTSLELTQDATNDDLFPSEAHKKLSMYSGGTFQDVDLAWTRIGGTGATAAIGGNNQVWYLGATTWSNPPPVTPTPTPTATATPTPTATPEPTPSPTPSGIQDWNTYGQ